VTLSQVHRKPHGSLLSASAILALLTSGCFVVIGDLPEPAEREPATGGSAGSSGGSGGSGATGGAPASGGTGASATGGTSAGAGGGGAGSGGSGACCDCDGDLAPAEGTCGGGDCDDADPLVKPGQTTFFDSQSSTVGWDYDCSGQIERESEQVNQCGVLGLGVGCTDRPEGWLAQAPPPCGSTGTWGKCKLGPANLTCVEDVLDPNKPVRCH
jgi:hypothetical protein